MQDRRDAGLKGCRTGRMQDRWDDLAGLKGCRIGGMWDGMQNMRDAGDVGYFIFVALALINMVILA